MPSGSDFLPHREGIEDDASSSLYHNPFTGHSDTTFTSAVRPNETRVVTRPVLRRRVSDGAAERARNDHDPWQEEERAESSHLRSRTVDSGVASSSNGRTSQHPLSRHSRSVRSNGSIVSLNDTRPRLKRLLSDMGSSSLGHTVHKSKDSDSEPEEDGAQRVVIVHEVHPSDSLAGVALKYGVSLADLRRANQMWASDSIHLRKVLYIPVEKTQKSKEYHLALVNLETRPPSAASEPPLSSYSPSPGPIVTNTIHSNVTIRRVPASQLSYFPPSSTPLLLDQAGHTLPRPRTGYPQRKGLPFDMFSAEYPNVAPPSADDASTSHQPSFVPQPIRSQISSLFSALPIAPSTRDTLIARLSYDSSASTPTQGSDEQEHEMGDVSGSSFRSTHSHDSVQRHGLMFAQPNGPVSIDPFDKGLELRAMSPPSTPPLQRRTSLGDPATGIHTTPPDRGSAPAPYASPERPSKRPEVVRTAQLQPSLGMQLPLRSRRSKDGTS